MENIELRDRLRAFIRNDINKAPTGWAPDIGIGHMTLFSFLEGKGKPHGKTIDKITDFLKDK